MTGSPQVGHIITAFAKDDVSTFFLGVVQLEERVDMLSESYVLLNLSETAVLKNNLPDLADSCG